MRFLSRSSRLFRVSRVGVPVRLGEVAGRLDERVLPILGGLLGRVLRITRPRGALTAGAIAFGLVGAVFAVYTVSVTGSDDQLGRVVRVGVGEGDRASAYVSGTRAVVGTLDGPDRYALVSFVAYLGPDRLTPVLAPVEVSSVFTHVLLPKVPTQLLRLGAYQIPEDVVAAMSAAADDKDAQAANLDRMRALAQAHQDPRADVYAAGAAVDSAEATAYRQRCSCVYAAVVQGSPTALRVLLARPEVRTVDPVPLGIGLDRTVFRPPLPEETGVVSAAGDTDPDPLQSN